MQVTGKFTSFESKIDKKDPPCLSQNSIYLILLDFIIPAYQERLVIWDEKY